MTNTILMIGGAGFIGSTLFSENVAAGHITSKLVSPVVDVNSAGSFDPTL
jgi:nucleoside-diphosphate-sugar epimerase